MYKLLFCLLLFVFGTVGYQQAHAQAEELAELALDIEKLAQLKKILQDMYDGYKILTKGYNTIKDLTEGNFNLHKLFLDGLLTVSPTVKKYERIVEIIEGQQTLITQYKAALKNFKGLNVFSSGEMDYVESVYSNLFDGSVKNLDALLMVITDSKLRMNDAERIHTIDQIYDDMQDKLGFLQNFNSKTAVLAQQRQKEVQETQSLRKLFGIQN